MAISEETARVVRESLPLLRQKGTKVVETFYDTLFERYPQVRQQFNADRQRGGTTKENGIPAQISRLANAVLAYAKNINKIEALLPAVRRIAYRHICRDVRAEQYAAVGECLLIAMKLELRDLASQQFLDAWKEAIQNLASVFIDVENKLREELEAKAGYSGLVEMIVQRVEQHDGKTVLSVVPKQYDVPQHEEGQFVGIRVEYADGEHGMCTMNVWKSHQDCLKIEVADNEEKATRALKACTEGSKIWVSVPCGSRRT
ncbi:dihydropteridine reductase [Gracilaria domingensis]|nr:dihydropteridine reductase [Gracilaria domingensis]